MVQPSLASSSPMTRSYWVGFVMTTVTKPWFFAAERSIEGPPMSICSIASSFGDAVLPNGLLEGVEIDADDVDGLDAVGVPWPRRASRDRGVRGCRRARSGCSVLTRPSIISGKPVRVVDRRRARARRRSVPDGCRRSRRSRCHGPSRPRANGNEVGLVTDGDRVRGGWGRDRACGSRGVRTGMVGSLGRSMECRWRVRVRRGSERDRSARSDRGGRRVRPPATAKSRVAVHGEVRSTCGSSAGSG